MKSKLFLLAAIMVVILAITLLALDGSGGAAMFEDGFKAFVNSITSSAPSGPETEEEITRVENEVTVETGTQETLSPELMAVQKKNENRLVEGCLAGRDCIPSIDEPVFVTVGKAGFLKNDDLVIGLDYEGEVRAYPLKIMDEHEVVNDVSGGDRFVVTYCPLSGTAAAYERGSYAGEKGFGVSGKLLNNNLVLYDRETDGFWSQMTGEALTGPQTGKILVDVPVQVMSYKEWLAGNPKTKILSTATGFKRDYETYPYGDYRESPVVYYSLEHWDGRLSPKAVVFGIVAGEKAKAYPLMELQKAFPEGGEFEDTIGDIKIIVSYKDGFVSFADSVTENSILFRPAYWFAWAAFYPQTEIFTGTRRAAILPGTLSVS